MKSIAQFFRLLHIQFVLARYGLDRVILSLPWFSPLRFLSIFNPWNWFRHEDFDRAEAIRYALEELGPVFVKFGQALSTRPDLVPDDIIRELAKLQDRVPPFNGTEARKIVEKIYKKPIAKVFWRFEEEPLASASIAQVHAAELFDGQKVVVKILRPKIQKVISRDIQLMYTFARLAEKYWADGKRFRPVAVVAEFQRTILDELDFMREAANASQLRRNFENSDLLYVPEIYWSYTHEKVLVMERINGIPITNIEELKARNVNIRKLAENGVEIFFTQVFRDSFFHADMHPGNIFVSVENPDSPKYICVDFGIMGTLDSNDKRYLAENFHAFFQRDYRRVAELHVESGWVPYKTRIVEFEAAIRTVCEPIFQKPLKEISCAVTLVKLFQTGRRFDMYIQPQLILLQKTLFAIEGLGRQLYPDLDLWNTAKPYLERWMREQISPQVIIRKIAQDFPYWLRQIPDLPVLLHDVLRQHKEYNRLRSEIPDEKLNLRLQRQRLFGYGIGLAFIFIGSLEILLMKEATLTTLELTKFNCGLLFVGAILILGTWIARES